MDWDFNPVASGHCKLLEVWIIVGFNLSYSPAWRLIIDGLGIWIKYLFS